MFLQNFWCKADVSSVSPSSMEDIARNVGPVFHPTLWLKTGPDINPWLFSATLKMIQNLEMIGYRLAHSACTSLMTAQIVPFS